MKQEDAQRRIAEVLHVLEQAGLPADLRPVAFQCLWNSLGEVATKEGQTQPRPEEASASIAGLAQRLRLEDSVLTDIYEQDEEGALMPHVPTARLEQAKAVATTQLALLVCAGRQGSVEQATSTGGRPCRSTATM